MYDEKCNFEPGIEGWPEEETVPLEDICIPLNECVCVKPGPVSNKLINILVKEKYDNSPVYDAKIKKYYGLAQTSYLQQLMKEDNNLLPDDPHIRAEHKNVHVRNGLGIFQLIKNLKIEPAIVLIQEYDSDEYGYCESPLGLFTIADLNRQEIRAIIYRLFINIELELSKLIQYNIPKPLEWISLLNEEHQVRILGYWELAKIRGMDIGPLAATTLSNLLTIIRKADGLCKLLGFKSREEFDKYSGQLPDFRNRIMHSVRPIILDRKDVKDLYKVIRFLKILKFQVDQNL